MSRRLLVNVAIVVVCALLAVATLGGALTQERAATSTVVTSPPFRATAVVELKARQRACVSDFVLPRDAEVAVLLLDQGERDAPPVDVTADGPGYTSPVTRVPGGATGRVPLSVRITPPPRDLLARICVRNAGARKLRLVGTQEYRQLSPAKTTVDGRDVGPDLALTLQRERRVTAVGFLPTILDRAAELSGLPGAGWLIWVLLAAVVVGVPVAVLTALTRALRADELR